MQTEWYIKEAKKQLNDTNTYKALTEPPNITNIVMDLNSIMNSQTWLLALVKAVSCSTT